MNKKQIQQRVLQNGKPIALSKFTWAEETLTFASEEGFLVIDFSYIDDVTVTAGRYSTVTAGRCSTVTTGERSNVKTGERSTVTTGWRSTVKCEGEDIAIINRNVFEVITPKKGQTIQINPYDTPGHVALEQGEKS